MTPRTCFAVTCRGKKSNSGCRFEVDIVFRFELQVYLSFRSDLVRMRHDVVDGARSGIVDVPLIADSKRLVGVPYLVPLQFPLFVR